MLPARVDDVTQRLAALHAEHGQYLAERLSEELELLPRGTRGAAAAEDGLASDAAVRRWLPKGWSPPPPAVRTSFLGWVRKAHAEAAQRLRTRPKDRDFKLWAVMQQQGGAAAS